MVEKGSFVELVTDILSSDDRAEHIPQDTRRTPLKQWIKGWLLEDSELGCRALISTVNGRVLEGILSEVNPCYSHDFGQFVPEIMYIGQQAKRLLWGD